MLFSRFFFAAIDCRGAPFFPHHRALSYAFSLSLSLISLSTTKPLPYSQTNRKKPSVDGGAPKKDFTTAILERKKSPNRLIVDDATNDDNR